MCKLPDNERNLLLTKSGSSGCVRRATLGLAVNRGTLCDLAVKIGACCERLEEVMHSLTFGAISRLPNGCEFVVSIKCVLSDSDVRENRVSEMRAEISCALFCE